MHVLKQTPCALRNNGDEREGRVGCLNGTGANLMTYGRHGTDIVQRCIEPTLAGYHRDDLDQLDQHY